MSDPGISFASINASVGAIVTQREAVLKKTISGMDANASTAQMLAMQQEVQQWSIFTQIQSTIVKELSDALKGVIQKAS